MPLISQQGDRKSFDVLILGSGSAALSYALTLSKLRPSVKIALVTKSSLQESNSYYAQGGIAAVTASAQDSIEQHVADTLAAGDGLCLEKAVRQLITAGAESIEALLAHGVRFDRDEKSSYDLAQEAGHSVRRIFHRGDHTGREIIQSLMNRIKQHDNIHCFTQHIAINLITQSRPHEPGNTKEAIGCYVLDQTLSLIHTFLANIVVLATGGTGKTYRYTTNPETATGDGIAMAYRADARVGNMEFYQFHPTLLYHPTMNNFLITEAIRGEGAYLRLADTGERFMQRYAPDKMELATRDIVARAIFSEIERSGLNYVHLDVTHLDKTFLLQHFPTIYQTLAELGLYMEKDYIPVVPAAHYLCGGILTNVNGQTDLQRLYAIGETAFTGFHGANRLASNSLLETVAMANFAAQDSLQWLDKPLMFHQRIKEWDSQSVTDRRRASQINAHWRGLRGEMTSYAGIIRTEAGLKDLLQLILARRDIVEAYYWKHTITRDLIELRNIILVAELIVRSALHRRESRGGHYRADFPDKLSDCEETLSQHLIYGSYNNA